jgi:excisionase family DNA binding protein
VNDNGAPDRLLHASEAAAFLDVPVSWVRQETRAERIPHIKLGRYRRYQKEALVAWIAQRQGGPSRAR